VGYSANAQLQQLFASGPLERACVRATRRVGRMITEGAADRTPVARRPRAVGRAEWIAARGGRVPGTMKESWETGDVERPGVHTFAIDSFTLDPAAPHVEWDTVPHIIRRKKAGALRFWDDVSIHFREAVNHPGTTGKHMMRDSLSEAEIRQRSILEAELEVWAREQLRLVR
jgi:hypothetical protein